MTLFRLKHALVVGGLAIFSQAHFAHAETVEQAVQAALAYHPSVESARAVLNAAAESERSEYSGFYPEVSVSSVGGRMYGDNSTSRGLSTTRGAAYSGLWEGTVTANQMIFDGLQTPSRVRAANAREHSADMDLADAKESLALRTVKSYINVLSARKALALLEEQKIKVADYLERIKGAVDEGTSDESEYQQARDVKVILDSFITDYQGQVRSSEAEYAEITGHFPEGDMEAPQPNIEFIPGNVLEAINYADAYHPTSQSAKFVSEAAAHDIIAENAQILPAVNGELSYYKTDKEDVIGGEAIDARAIVRLNWNFETGGGQLARIRKKKYEHQEAISRVREAKRLIEQGVRVAYSELETAQGQFQNQEKREDLNSKLFETYKVQFDGARISLLQLMQADNQLFNTKLEKMLGEQRVLTAQYDALASMGILQGSLALTDAQEEPVVAEVFGPAEASVIEPASGAESDDVVK